MGALDKLRICLEMVQPLFLDQKKMVKRNLRCLVTSPVENLYSITKTLFLVDKQIYSARKIHSRMAQQITKKKLIKTAKKERIPEASTKMMKKPRQ